MSTGTEKDHGVAGRLGEGIKPGVRNLRQSIKMVTMLRVVRRARIVSNSPMGRINTQFWPLNGQKEGGCSGSAKYESRVGAW